MPIKKDFSEDCLAEIFLKENLFAALNISFQK